MSHKVGSNCYLLNIFAFYTFPNPETASPKTEGTIFLLMNEPKWLLKKIYFAKTQLIICNSVIWKRKNKGKNLEEV